MREKLIELLETVVSPNELHCYGEVLVSTSRVADHLIANGVTFATDNKWIPVSEKLPEDDVLVLCIGAKCGMFLGYPRRVWDGESTAYTIVPNARAARYTKYWMPLPEPPKED